MREQDVERIRQMFRPGTQIVLQEMAGEPQMPPGLRGNVRFVDDIGQVHMRWENGSRLALHPFEDTFQVQEKVTDRDPASKDGMEMTREKEEKEVPER